MYALPSFGLPSVVDEPDFTYAGLRGGSRPTQVSSMSYRTSSLYCQMGVGVVFLDAVTCCFPLLRRACYWIRQKRCKRVR
jgi:hypothetical protein